MKNVIVKHRRVWYGIGAVLFLASLASVAVFGLKLGIDFTGGSLMELTLPAQTSVTDVRSVLQPFGYEEAVVQTTDEEGGYIVRLPSVTEEQHQSLLTAFHEKYGETVVEQKFDSIGPVIGAELRKTTTYGVIVVLVLIGSYVAFSFRKVTHPVASWKYGLLTIAAAFHDVVIPLGVFAVLGKFFHWEIDTAFVAAILTVLGYSITDTIVVFDRTRENLLAKKHVSFEETVETSLQQTIMRSLSTSVTTLLCLVAIFFFGGDTTRPFSLALIIGILAGTYSSLFLATPALVTWHLLDQKK